MKTLSRPLLALATTLGLAAGGASADQASFTVDGPYYGSNWDCLQAGHRAIRSYTSDLDFTWDDGESALWYQIDNQFYVTIKCYNSQMAFIHVHRVGSGTDAGAVREAIYNRMR
ncbi:hypothetical protein [Tropicibacter alexandrii]|uniref:hypothetical protein n=1 Tax=Tropicibacter alexandrii TaxID=2267683 RepID=UPI000EF483EE|nr:hypothetical protein [Tropicibacter alexandrii]